MGQGYSLTLWELRPGKECAFDGKACTFPIFEAVDARGQRLDLQSRGVVTSVLREAPGRRCFSFWDLDGNRLDACEIVESTPA